MKGFFGWFRNGAKMKRWIALILIGIILACYGMASILTAERLDFWPLAKIVTPEASIDKPESTESDETE